MVRLKNALTPRSPDSLFRYGYSYDSPMWDFFNGFFGTDRHDAHSMVSSQVTKTSTGEMIEIPAPGLKKEDFKVQLDGDELTISCHVEKAEKHESYKRSFSKSWLIDGSAPRDSIKASYVDGVLRVEIPAAKQKTSDPVDIKVQ